MANYQAGPVGCGMGRGRKNISKYKHYYTINFGCTLTKSHRYIACLHTTNKADGTHMTQSTKFYYIQMPQCHMAHRKCRLWYTSALQHQTVHTNVLTKSFFQQTMDKIQAKHVGVSVYVSTISIPFDANVHSRVEFVNQKTLTTMSTTL